MGQYRPLLVFGIILLAFGILFTLILFLTPSKEWERFIIAFDSLEVPGFIVFIIVAAIFTPVGILCLIAYIYYIRKYEHY